MQSHQIAILGQWECTECSIFTLMHKAHCTEYPAVVTIDSSLGVDGVGIILWHPWLVHSSLQTLSLIIHSYYDTTMCIYTVYIAEMIVYSGES